MAPIDRRKSLNRVGPRLTSAYPYLVYDCSKGRNIYQVAKNCRTSVEMIEKFYGRHLKNNIDASAVNVRKAKPPKVAARKKAAMPTT